MRRPASEQMQPTHIRSGRTLISAWIFADSNLVPTPLMGECKILAPYSRNRLRLYFNCIGLEKCGVRVLAPFKIEGTHLWITMGKAYTLDRG